ncbi:LOW QUALITY PROTEIN: hypothetical protein IG631_24306 [Alternaria alternata]|nr:LOW QUALITY PROTEIN: hypothetical protein IG631_24306 [Alternaria alternata]
MVASDRRAQHPGWAQETCTCSPHFTQRVRRDFLFITPVLNVRPTGSITHDEGESLCVRADADLAKLSFPQRPKQQITDNAVQLLSGCLRSTHIACTLSTCTRICVVLREVSLDRYHYTTALEISSAASTIAPSPCSTRRASRSEGSMPSTPHSKLDMTGTERVAALVSQNTRVRTVNFATSGHVQHAKLDVDKYKLAILEIWRDSRCQ